jgi:hypothetical protein
MAAGLSSLAKLLEALRSRRDGTLYRIRLCLSGSDPRQQLGSQAGGDADEREQLLSRLESLAIGYRLSPRGCALLAGSFTNETCERPLQA